MPLLIIFISDFSSFFNETYFDLRESSPPRVTVQNGSSHTLKCTIINRGDAVVKWIVTPKREGAFPHGKKTIPKN